MRRTAFRVLIRRVRHIKNYLQDPTASKVKKFLIVFGIIYLLSPIDLIPAPVLGFSIIDDAVLWGGILTYLADELDRYAMEESPVSREARKKYKGHTIIEAEARVVEEEEQDNPGGTV